MCCVQALGPLEAVQDRLNGVLTALDCPSRHAIDDRHVRTAAGPLGRLALSKCEAADALGVSVDFLEEHVMHELRIVRRGRRRLIPVRELERWLDENATLRLRPHAAPRSDDDQSES